MLKDKERQQWETQLAVAREILRAHSMARPESLVVQFGAQRLDKGGEIFWNRANNRLHPQVNKAAEKFVQFISCSITMRYLLIQWQCTPALSRRMGEGEPSPVL